MLHLINIAAEVADITTDRNRKAFIGAVAMRRDGVLVHARNSAVYSPNAKNPPAHSESRICKKSGAGSEIYVARVKRDGSLAMAKPCPRCMAIMRSHRVEMVYYSISPTEWGACKP